MAVSVEIPQEIIDRIIDELRKDIHSLKICSHVSRSFLPSCQRHIFYVVDLRESTGLPHRIRQLHQLLMDNPKLIPYIRKLLLTLSDRTDKVDVLSTLLQKIVNVRSLSLAFMCRDWSALPAGLRSSLSGLFRSPKLEAIDLAFVQNFPMSILSLCNQLKRLEVDYVTPSSSDILESDEVEPIQARGYLSSLILQNGTSSDAPTVQSLLQALTHPGSQLGISQLRFFATHVRTSESFIFQEILLGLCASSLEHLSLSVSYWPGCFVPFSLSMFSHLRRLDLSMFSQFDVELTPWIEKLLDSVPEPNFVTHVFLEFAMSEQWGQLVELIDSGFSGPKFAQLRTISILGRSTSSEAQPWNFPRLSSKGILSPVHEKTTRRWDHVDEYEDHF